MAAVSRERLPELEDAVCVRRQDTIENVALQFSQADLVETIRRVRLSMRETLATLLPAAFEPRSPGASSTGIGNGRREDHVALLGNYQE